MTDPAPGGHDEPDDLDAAHDGTDTGGTDTGGRPDHEVADDTARPRRDPRVRLVGAVLGAGVGLAVVVAFASGLLGASGAVSAVVMLVLLGTTFAVASLVALGTAVVDEYRGRPVGRSRIVVGVVTFVATIVVMAMAAGGSSGA